jgi:hypothetical protein
VVALRAVVLRAAVVRLAVGLAVLRLAVVLRLAAALLTGPRFAALLTVVARRVLVVRRAVLVAAVFSGTDLPLQDQRQISDSTSNTNLHMFTPTHSRNLRDNAHQSTRITPRAIASRP